MSFNHGPNERGSGNKYRKEINPNLGLPSLMTHHLRYCQFSSSLVNGQMMELAK